MEEYSDNQQVNDFENPQPQRPTALSMACVLSFINAGFQFISNIFAFMMYNVMQTIGQDEDYLELMEKLSPDTGELETAMQAQLAVSRVSYLLAALLFVGSFVGVYYMWKQLKKGFHIYAISQILLLIVTSVFVTSVTGDSIWGGVILTAIWIGIYYMFSKKYMQ